MLPFRTQVKDGATFCVDAQPEEVHFVRSPSGALYLPCTDAAAGGGVGGGGGGGGAGVGPRDAADADADAAAATASSDHHLWTKYMVYKTPTSLSPSLAAAHALHLLQQHLVGFRIIFSFSSSHSPMGLPSFTGFYWVFIGFSWFFYWVLLGLIYIYWFCIGFYRVFTGFYQFLLGVTGFYLVLLGFT